MTVINKKELDVEVYNLQQLKDKIKHISNSPCFKIGTGWITSPTEGRTSNPWLDHENNIKLSD